MRRLALALVVVGVMMAGRAWGQAPGRLENLQTKADITPGDRQDIRAWLRPFIDNLVASTDPELKEMIRARIEIDAEARRDSGWSPAFIQAYGEEAVARIEAADDRAISIEARINLVMTAADLDRTEAAPFLVKVLDNDPYQSTRYLAAAGLARISRRAASEGLTRVEETITGGIRKVFDTEKNGLTFYWLFEALSHFDLEQSHDVLCFGAGVAATRLQASDPVDCRALESAVRALEQAYGTEVRADGKERILTAYAVLCAWIMPPTADPNLMPTLNASLEKGTKQSVNFPPPGQDEVMQKLALLDWVEKLVREKRIPKRPALPAAIENTVRAVKQESP